jgi:lipopolysaccharide transport system ATP-binding protein
MSMAGLAVRIENIGKRYRLQHRQKNEEDTLLNAFAGGLRSFFSPRHGAQVSEDFWAVRNISFDVQSGDRVGIIGRNGAGKSTLLKILSRIVQPTEGSIEYHGRIASLLEVGTGFHGDLTGRENIYLNGSILGMSRQEIDRQFDAIVEFSEVSRFLDTPVKRYSSGMYVRLAFAVAAHLDPEILVVDEVLAVGDAAFQKKCLNRMSEISREGKTLFFVSHNMAAVQNLCEKCVYLNRGRLVQYGDTSLVIPEYLKASMTAARTELRNREDRSGSGQMRFTGFRITGANGEEMVAAHCGSPVTFQVEIYAEKPVSGVTIAMGIDDSFGQRIAHCSNEATDQVFERVDAGTRTVNISFPHFPLKSGEYTFTLFATAGGDIADWVQDAGAFSVEAGDYYRSGKLPPEGQASVLVDHTFKLD